MLGNGWLGCSREYEYPTALFDADYGEPAGLCRETAPGSEVFFARVDQSNSADGLSNVDGHFYDEVMTPRSAADTRCDRISSHVQLSSTHESYII